MDTLFLTILNMSIVASWVAAIVVVLRLLLHKAPKWIAVLLWALVAVRLLCPFAVETTFSLIPTTEPVAVEHIAPAAHAAPDAGVSAVTPSVDANAPSQAVPDQPSAPTPTVPVVVATEPTPPSLLSILSTVWMAGVAAMLLYTVISYICLRMRVREAGFLEGRVWQCDRIDTPFILGVIRPRIYLPSTLSSGDMTYVIAHETAHIKRGDHLWKPLGFLLLAVYWFNPVLWIAYVLFCRDIEFACDEKALQTMGDGAKKPYSDALINCSVPRRLIAACPLAFGETGVKKRVVSILNYKKPAFWIAAVAIVACVAVSVFFLTDPASPPEQKETNGATVTTTTVSTVTTTQPTASSTTFGATEDTTTAPTASTTHTTVTTTTAPSTTVPTTINTTTTVKTTKATTTSTNRVTAATTAATAPSTAKTTTPTAKPTSAPTTKPTTAPTTKPTTTPTTKPTTNTGPYKQETVTPTSVKPGETLTFSVVIKDEDGVNSPKLSIYSGGYATVGSVPLTRVSGDKYDGVYTAQFTVPEYFPAGSHYSGRASYTRDNKMPVLALGGGGVPFTITEP